MKTKIGVKILPREVLLDTQGRAVEQTLKNNKNLMNAKDVHVRVGKYVELTFDLPVTESEKEAHQMAKSILINPLIEQYTLEVLQAEK
jgi:phosphoribosylformylglycinamidine (FGAM) synthase PurS component